MVPAHNGESGEKPHGRRHVDHWTIRDIGRAARGFGAAGLVWGFVYGVRKLTHGRNVYTPQESLRPVPLEFDVVQAVTEVSSLQVEPLPEPVNPYPSQSDVEPPAQTK